MTGLEHLLKPRLSVPSTLNSASICSIGEEKGPIGEFASTYNQEQLLVPTLGWVVLLRTRELRLTSAPCQMDGTQQMHPFVKNRTRGLLLDAAGLEAASAAEETRSANLDPTGAKTEVQASHPGWNH